MDEQTLKAIIADLQQQLGDKALELSQVRAAAGRQIAFLQAELTKGGGEKVTEDVEVDDTL